MVNSFFQFFLFLFFELVEKLKTVSLTSLFADHRISSWIILITLYNLCILNAFFVFLSCIRSKWIPLILLVLLWSEKILLWRNLIDERTFHHKQLIILENLLSFLSRITIIVETRPNAFSAAINHLFNFNIHFIYIICHSQILRLLRLSMIQ